MSSELEERLDSASFQYIVAIVIRTPFAPTKDSLFDVGLLRAGNQFLIRQRNGIEDSFLFLVIGNEDEGKKVSIQLNEYGFFDFNLITIDGEDNYDIEINEIGREISHWLEKNHSDCVPYLGKTVYDNLSLFDLFWWLGIKDCQKESTYLWSFPVKDFAQLLPSSYADAASTWLTILAKAMDMANPEYDYDLENNKNSLFAATLCEWLHGFEKASGNGYNDFDPENSIKLLNIDDFFLGYTANSYYDNLQDLFYDVECDYESMKPHLIKKITEDNRYKMRCGLSQFFDSDAGLFWALYSSIWTHYERPMWDLCNRLAP
jgi:hypothetical protein